MSPGAAAGYLQIAVKHEVMRTKTKVKTRMPRAANQLRNAELRVLRGPSPSAPGGTPGVRTGNLRRNWTMFSSSEIFGIESGMGYAGYLEHGTRKMAARPFVDKIQQEAMPKIRAIFEEIGG